MPTDSWRVGPWWFVVFIMHSHSKSDILLIILEAMCDFVLPVVLSFETERLGFRVLQLSSGLRSGKGAFLH